MKVELNKIKADYLLDVDRKLYTSADTREAWVDSQDDVHQLELDLIEAELDAAETEADYYGDVNFFQGVQEMARNLRAEMRNGLNDNA
jgi:hypothetical protein